MSHLNCMGWTRTTFHCYNRKKLINHCDSDTSGDDLSSLEAAGSPSSSQRPSLFIVGHKQDKEEEALVFQFLADGCGCNKLLSVICSAEIQSLMLDLSTTEVDLAVLVQIAARLFATELQMKSED